MQKREKNKHIQINIEYDTWVELERILKHVRKLAISGVEHYKEQINGTKYEYNMRYEADPELEVRFEEINGKPCIVIPSKMNNE